MSSHLINSYYGLSNRVSTFKLYSRNIVISTIRLYFSTKQLLNKYFSAWYGVVLEQRVKMGKARAVSDWRCKLRAWNAWKAYVSHIKSSKEAEAIAVAMKEKYRYGSGIS